MHEIVAARSPRKERGLCLTYGKETPPIKFTAFAITASLPTFLTVASSSEDIVILP